MAEDMQVRNLSPCTQDTYIRQVSLFARHFAKSPELLGPEQIREYQVHLATGKRLAPGSIGVAVAALRFLYGVTLHKDWNIPEVLPTPKQPTKLPMVPSPEEVVSFRDAAPSSATASSSPSATRRDCASPRRSGCAQPTSTAGAWSSASSRARAARTAASCSPRACWRLCATTGGTRGPQASGCSPA
ncbi:MAG: site-specific integrase [Bryobacterales bacterium]|nr:site-specific integrase [Bryobacterales bacterium]